MILRFNFCFNWFVCSVSLSVYSEITFSLLFSLFFRRFFLVLGLFYFAGVQVSTKWSRTIWFLSPSSPPPNHILCLPFACGKFYSKDQFNQRSEKCWKKGKQCQFSSITQSCQTLCNPMDCSMPGFSVHHQLPELAQIHVHWVGDDIQPSHPLPSPSPPVFNLSQN